VSIFFVSRLAWDGPTSRPCRHSARHRQPEAAPRRRTPRRPGPPAGAGIRCSTVLQQPHRLTCKPPYERLAESSRTVSAFSSPSALDTSRHEETSRHEDTHPVPSGGAVRRH
jgi:hypothetical protein